MNKSSPLPFGLQFTEQPANNKLNFPSSVYDEEEDISIVLNERGQRIPAVSYTKMGTKTMTHVDSEDTDDDDAFSNMSGTKTATAVEEEAPDSDDDYFFLALSTKTETFVQSEGSDQDPSIDSGPKSPINTATATKVAQEVTDND